MDTPRSSGPFAFRLLDPTIFCYQARSSEAASLKQKAYREDDCGGKDLMAVLDEPARDSSPQAAVGASSSFQSRRQIAVKVTARAFKQAENKDVIGSTRGRLARFDSHSLFSRGCLGFKIHKAS
jgi:hypothetical protein